MRLTIRKKYLFYVIAFTSSIIAAAVSGIDVYVTQVVIGNPWAFGFALFLSGILITLLIGLLLSIPIKNKSIGHRFIDPSFQRLRMITRKEVPYHVLAGIGNAGMTIGYFFLLDVIGDPSIVLPFSQISILYIVIVESFSEKNMPTLVEIQSAVIVTFGALLGSISLSGSLDGISLLVVFLVINPCWVLFSVYQRKLKLLRYKERFNDSINIRFWNVLFSCFFTAVIIFVFDMFNGSNHLGAGITASVTYFPWLALVMIFTFFESVLFIRALGIGKASVTQAVRASIIIFAIPVSLVLAFFGLIEPLATDPTLILIKIIGFSLILLGLVSYALTLVKAYLFIRIKPGHDIEETMQAIWKIRGVNRVCAVSGPYDFVAKIRTRTLVQGYEKIVKKIAEIDGIASFTWQSVLKDWEEL